MAKYVIEDQIKDGEFICFRNPYPVLKNWDPIKVVYKLPNKNLAIYSCENEEQAETYCAFSCLIQKVNPTITYRLLDRKDTEYRIYSDKHSISLSIEDSNDAFTPKGDPYTKIINSDFEKSEIRDIKILTDKIP